MANNPPIKRFLDAGVQFTEMTQSRAEAIVKDLVKAGEVQAEQAQKFVDDLVARSRKNSERLREAVRKEVQNQVSNLGLATKEDIARIEKKIAASAKPAKKATKKKKAAKKKATKKTAKK
jgi:polyhydroxyalkanoate synthesis regulator phasin